MPNRLYTLTAAAAVAAAAAIQAAAPAAAADQKAKVRFLAASQYPKGLADSWDQTRVMRWTGKDWRGPLEGASFDNKGATSLGEPCEAQALRTAGATYRMFTGWRPIAPGPGVGNVIIEGGTMQQPRDQTAHGTQFVARSGTDKRAEKTMIDFRRRFGQCMSDRGMTITTHPVIYVEDGMWVWSSLEDTRMYAAGRDGAIMTVISLHAATASPAQVLKAFRKTAAVGLRQLQ